MPMKIRFDVRRVDLAILVEGRAAPVLMSDCSNDCTYRLKVLVFIHAIRFIGD